MATRKSRPPTPLLDPSGLSRLDPTELASLARTLFARDGWQADGTAREASAMLQRGDVRLLLQLRGTGRWDVTPEQAQEAETAGTEAGAAEVWLVTSGIFSPAAWDHVRRTRVRLADRNLLMQWLRDRLPERCAPEGRERVITCNRCGTEDRVRFTVDGHGPLFCSRCYRRRRRAPRGAGRPAEADGIDWAA